MKPRAFLVDDEPLALRRLEQLLKEDGRVEVLGAASDPERASLEIELLAPDVLFLDIQMPGLTGFDLLGRLEREPLVIFTTAYDQYALRAFEHHSVDYLLKPIEREQLERALGKLERVLGGAEPRPEMRTLLKQITTALQAQPGAGAGRLERIPSRSGERVHFLELRRITHFFAEDKLTFAVTAEKKWVVDRTIAELEQKLDGARWVRVHRSTIVNLEYVDELYNWFGGRMMLRLKDAKKTQIAVSRERLKELKDRLGL
ncbi:MAG: LytR/AlgR family response regulator transcription factor [Bryobacteraceae bacterium]